MRIRSLFAGLLCLAGIAALAQQDGPALIILDVTEDRMMLDFDTPIDSEDPAIAGRSLAQLVDDRPLFPPIPGLPAEAWEDRTCSGCHHWTKETLCAQAQTYLSKAGAPSLEKVHPYGGGFKRRLRDWGAQGCN